MHQYKNWMMYCEQRPSLLMKCFKTFLRYKRQMGGASNTTCLPLMGVTIPSSANVISQIAYKMQQDFRYPLTATNGLLHYKERHPLLMKCFKTFLWCIRQMGGASEITCLPLMASLCNFPSASTSNCSQNTHILVTLSVWHNGWYIASRDINCLWSVSTPCFQCIRQIGGALDSIWMPVMGVTMPFSTNINS